MSAARVMRHDEPIFLPFNSPDSSTAMHVGLADAERARGIGRAQQLGRRRAGAAAPPAKPCCIICCARPKPTASSAAVPAGPAPPLPFSMPCAIWYFT